MQLRRSRVQKCKRERQKFFSGLGSQVIRTRVRVRVLNQHLMPNTRTWDLTAETRDLRMIHRVAGFPLRHESLRAAKAAFYPLVI